MDERQALVALNMIDGIGSVKLNRLIGRFGGGAEAFNASYGELISVEGIGHEISEAIKRFDHSLLDKELAGVKEKNIEIITIYDDNYPVLLKQIFDPPPVLYKTGGDIPPADLSIGIVGTRVPTDYGEDSVKKIVKEMKASGLNFNIISGMARGVDSIAHHEAITNGIYNIAVLGFGLNRVYPFTGHYLAKDIIKNGCLLSEFPMNMIGLKQNFPRRNRIISGLSQGCVIVEAGKRSGALITADCALEQCREVFSIPGNIFSEKSMGTNNLIKQGAKLTTCLKDILEEFEVRQQQVLFTDAEPGIKELESLTDDEKIIYQVLGAEKKHIDNISIESNIDTVRLNGIMTMLELKGFAKQLSGKNFIRAR
jgi:DNA processing protein